MRVKEILTLTGVDHRASSATTRKASSSYIPWRHSCTLANRSIVILLLSIIKGWTQHTQLPVEEWLTTVVADREKWLWKLSSDLPMNMWYTHRHTESINEKKNAIHGRPDVLADKSILLSKAVARVWAPESPRRKAGYSGVNLWSWHSLSEMRGKDRRNSQTLAG